MGIKEKNIEQVKAGIERLPEDSIQRINTIVKNNNLSPLEYTVKDNLLFIGNNVNPLFYLIGSNDDFNPEVLVIPEGTIMIADYAFKDKKSIKEVKFPDSLEFLGWYTFDGTSIKDVYISEGKLAYDETLIAFDGNPGPPLDTVSLPYSMYQIYKEGKDVGLVEAWNRTCKIIYRNSDDSIAEILEPHPLDIYDSSSGKEEISHDNDSDELPF